MDVCNWQCTIEAVKRLGKALSCGVCHEPLREPCTLGSCDHLFCRSCVSGHLGKTCPSCQAPAWVKDLQLKRELASVVGLYHKLRAIVSPAAPAATQDNGAAIKGVVDRGAAMEGGIDGRVAVECGIVQARAKRGVTVVGAGLTEKGEAEMGVAGMGGADQGMVNEGRVDGGTVDKDVADEGMANNGEVFGGRRIVLEIAEQRISDGGSRSHKQSGPIVEGVSVRKALRPRNVSPTKASAKKQKAKRSGGMSQPGGVPTKKKCSGVDNDNKSARRCQQTTEKGERDAASSSSSNHDLMSVYDFVASPKRPQETKKRPRKPSAKVLKRRRLAAANRNWLREGTPSKPSEESESGFDSERSLKRVSFFDEAEATPSQASMQGECSAESTVAPCPRDAGLAATPTSTQESGYVSGGDRSAASAGLNKVEQPPSKSHCDTASQNSRQPRRQRSKGDGLTNRPARSAQTVQDHAAEATVPGRLSSRRNPGSAASGDQGNDRPPSREEPRKRRQEVSPGESRRLAGEEFHPAAKRRLGGGLPEIAGSVAPEAGTRSKTPSADRTLDPSPQSQPRPNLGRTRSKAGGKTSCPPTANPKKIPPPTSSSLEELPSSGERKKTIASLRSGSVICKKNKRGETPLHIAAIKGDLETATRLLEDGADQNTKDNAGWTPLILLQDKKIWSDPTHVEKFIELKHEASNHGNTSVVALLLDNGALINAPGFEHDSPLHDAVLNQRPQVVQLLLQRGASLTVRNMHGLTPADCATTDQVRAALKTKPLVTAATEPSITVSQKSLLARNRPVVLLGTGLKESQRKLLQSCAKLLGGGRVVAEFGSEVTHLVAACNQDNLCPRTMKYLNAVLSGQWVLSFEWVTRCLQSRKRAPETDFEVKGTTALPTSSGPAKGRRNKDQQLPSLLDGCHFYLYSTFSPPTPSKSEVAQLIRNGGGTILVRQPRPDDDVVQSSATVPYHAQAGSALAACSYYVVHDHVEGRAPPRVRTGKLCTAPVSWLMDCISQFELLDLPG